MTTFESAISPHHNVTVAASAGTGKTYLLVTRIIRILLEGIAPDAVLAITFTRKAANEIHERLTARLYDLAVTPDDQLGPALARLGLSAREPYLTRARHLYESLLRQPRRVRTATFHAFCQTLLRQFPLEADVPPGFALLDNTTPLRDSAWDALYREAAQYPDGATALAMERIFNYTNSIASTRTALDNFWRQRADWWAYTERQADPVAFAVARLPTVLDFIPGVDAYGDFFPRRRDQLEQFQLLLEKNTSVKNAEHARRLREVLQLDQFRDEEFDRVASVFLKADGEPRSRAASAAQRKRLGNDEDTFLQLHATLCAAILDVIALRRKQLNAEMMEAFYRAGNCLIDHYQRIKREQRLLDFADLEWQAYRLLTANEHALWVQYKLDQRIDHLLVDEFQDTNPTQWRLLLPLLQEFAAGGDRSRSAFIVGDAKQSIYRFRRADAGLLTAAGQWLDSHLAGLRFPMDSSRRSAPAIIDLVNRVFTQPSVQARMPDFTPHQTHQHEAWGQVEIWPLLPPPDDTQMPAATAWRNPLLTPRVTPRDDRHYQDGCRVARHIQDTLAAHRAQGLHFGNVMILLRSRTHAPSYEQALRDHGIPFSGIERGTLLDTQEVQDMVALLMTLRVPFDDIALATVLRCPVFSLSDAQLILIALAPGAHWNDRLRAAADANPNQTQLERARILLTRWQAASERLPVHDLLDKIYCEGDVLASYAAAYPAHMRARVRGNLLRIIDLALTMDSGRYPSLGRFLRELEELRMQDEGAPDAAPPLGDVPSVRVLTVHAAKGLEAALVYLVDAASVTGNDRAYAALVRWPAGAAQPDYFGLALRAADLDSAHRGIAESNADAQRREETNLLYVALTRARHQLIVTGIVGQNDGDHWHQTIADALDWPDKTVPWRASNGTPTPQVQPSSPPQNIPPPHAMTASAMVLSSDATPLVESDNAVQRARGRLVHRVLELLDQKTDLEGIRARIRREHPYFGTDEVADDCIAEAQSLMDMPAIKTVLETPIDGATFVELPLSSGTGDDINYGIPDRLIVTPQWIRIVDFKTERDVTAESMDLHAGRHVMQLQRYASIAARCWPGRPIEGVIIFSACRAVWKTALSVDG